MQTKDEAAQSSQQVSVISKLDLINEKLEQLKILQQQQQANPMGMMPNMETTVLLFNIQRIVRENEQLKKDLYDKSNKIEEQNGKITELLSRNQNYIEKSHLILEQKNETFQSSAEKNALRVLELEQDKMRLTGELSRTTAIISDLNMHINKMQTNEVDMQARLIDLTKQGDLQRTDLDQIKLENIELNAKYRSQADELKRDRQTRGQLETSLKQLDDEKNEIKQAYNNLDRSFNEKKLKFDGLRKQHESELDDVRRAYERDLDNLKEKLNSYKSSMNQTSTEQMRQLEADLTNDWQLKTDKLLKTQELKYERLFERLREDKDEAVRRVDEHKDTMKQLRVAEMENEALKETVDELNMFKEKFNRLKAQSLIMKDRYETRIKELIDADPDPEVICTEIKTSMNYLYRKLKQQIDTDYYYNGQDLLGSFLKLIKLTTVRIIKAKENNNEDLMATVDGPNVDDDANVFDEIKVDFNVEREKFESSMLTMKSELDDVRLEMRKDIEQLTCVLALEKEDNATKANQLEMVKEELKLIKTKEDMQHTTSVSDLSCQTDEFVHVQQATVYSLAFDKVAVQDVIRAGMDDLGTLMEPKQMRDLVDDNKGTVCVHHNGSDSMSETSKVNDKLLDQDGHVVDEDLSMDESVAANERRASVGTQDGQDKIILSDSVKYIHAIQGTHVNADESVVSENESVEASVESERIFDVDNKIEDDVGSHHDAISINENELKPEETNENRKNQDVGQKINQLFDAQDDMDIDNDDPLFGNKVLTMNTSEKNEPKKQRKLFDDDDDDDDDLFLFSSTKASKVQDDTNNGQKSERSFVSCFSL